MNIETIYRRWPSPGVPNRFPDLLLAWMDYSALTAWDSNPQPIKIGTAFQTASHPQSRPPAQGGPGVFLIGGCRWCRRR